MANNITGETISQQASTVIDGSEFILVEKLVGDIAKNFGISVDEIRLFIEKEFKDKKVFVNDQAYVHTDENFTTALKQKLEALQPGGGGGGTTDYTQLDNKPAIGGVTLDGNKTPEQMGLQPQMDSNTVIATLNGQTVHYGDRVDLPGAGGSGSGIVVEAELNPVSTNAIQNGTVAKKIGELDSNIDSVKELIFGTTIKKQSLTFIPVLDNIERYFSETEKIYVYMHNISSNDMTYAFYTKDGTQATGNLKEGLNVLQNNSYHSLKCLSNPSVDIEITICSETYYNMHLKKYDNTTDQMAEIYPNFKKNRIVINGDTSLFAFKDSSITTTGKLTQSNGWVTTDFIPILGLGKLSVNANLANQYVAGIAVYDINKRAIKTISKVLEGSQSDNQPYEVPLEDIAIPNAIFIRVCSTSAKQKYMPKVDIQLDTMTNLRNLYSPLISQKKYSYDVKGDMSVGVPLKIEGYPSIHGKRVYTFSGFTDAFTDLHIIHNAPSNGPYTRGDVLIDNTNIVVQKWDKNDNPMTYKHGLTITNFINVEIITHEYLQTAKLVITTTSGQFVQEDISWNGDRGDITASTSNGNITNCRLSASLNPIYKDIWLFADSYGDMWPQKIKELGLDNFMVDNVSGRRSVDAYTSLLISLGYHLPKIIIWCLGMNDLEMEGDNGYKDWLRIFNSLQATCKLYNIELIAATIPSTQLHSNEKKNKIVRESGLRILDIAQAVGADKSFDWYQGLQSTDHTHPSPTGVDAIATYVTASISEIQPSM